MRGRGEGEDVTGPGSWVRGWEEAARLRSHPAVEDQGPGLAFLA